MQQMAIGVFNLLDRAVTKLAGDRPHGYRMSAVKRLKTHRRVGVTEQVPRLAVWFRDTRPTEHRLQASPNVAEWIS